MGLFTRPRGRPKKEVELTKTEPLIASEQSPFDLEVERQAAVREAKEPPTFNIEYETKDEIPGKTKQEKQSKADMNSLAAAWAEVEPYLSVWNSQEIVGLPSVGVKTLEIGLLSGILIELRQLRAVLERLESEGAQ